MPRRGAACAPQRSSSTPTTTRTATSTCGAPRRHRRGRGRRARRATREVEPARAGEEIVAGAEPLEDGPSIDAARGWARRLGSTCSPAASPSACGPDRPFNTSVLIDPDGEAIAIYRKIHMFDVDVGGVAYRESEHERAGEEIVTAEAAGLEIGLTVCYDLRFPELYRILAVRGAACSPCRRRSPRHRPRGALGGPAAGPGDREPGLRRRPEPVRRGAPALPLLRALDDRRPLGRGPRPGPERRRA